MIVIHRLVTENNSFFITYVAFIMIKLMSKMYQFFWHYQYIWIFVILLTDKSIYCWTLQLDYNEMDIYSITQYIIPTYTIAIYLVTYYSGILIYQTIWKIFNKNHYSPFFFPVFSFVLLIISNQDSALASTIYGVFY